MKKTTMKDKSAGLLVMIWGVIGLYIAYAYGTFDFVSLVYRATGGEITSGLLQILFFGLLLPIVYIVTGFFVMKGKRWSKILIIILIVIVLGRGLMSGINTEASSLFGLLFQSLILVLSSLSLKEKK